MSGTHWVFWRDDKKTTVDIIPRQDMGGTTGGERESNIRIAVAWDPGRWPDGGPETPDLFWEFYLHEQVAEGYLAEVETKCQE